MAVIEYPASDPAFCPVEFWIGLQSNVEIRTSRTFRISTSQLPGTRIMIRMTLPDSGPKTPEQARVEAFAASLEGQANTVLLHHLRRPVPVGTLRGNPTSGSAARGARSIVINGQSGETLEKGDILGLTTGLGLQLVVVTDVSGTGTITITFAGPLKAAVPSGSPVYWNRPSAGFILTQPIAMVGYAANRNLGASFEFMEI